MKKFLDLFFELNKNKTSFGQEFRAGLTTFCSMAYIIHIHPFIISQAGVDFSASVTTTVLVCFFSSLTMSVYARNPLAMAPGLGVNVFFTYTLVLQMGIPFEVALGATFWSGVLFLLLSIFKIREWFFQNIPMHLKRAISAGIGLMIALVGFQQGGLILSSKETLLQMAPFSLEFFLFIFALVITGIIVLKKIKGSFLLSMALITLFLIPFGRWMDTPLIVEYKGLISWPDFSLIGKVDFIGSLHWSILPTLLSLAFVDLFESFGTLMSVLCRYDLNEKDDKHRPRRLKESLISDALGTIYSSLLGSSSATTYVESATGLQEGGRTGLCALVTSLLFLPFLFFAPLLSMIPSLAISPVLVIVGVFMVEPIRHIQWKKLEEAIPAFLTMTLIPFALSITPGIVWGLVAYIFICVLQKVKFLSKNEAL